MQSRPPSRILISLGLLSSGNTLQVRDANDNQLTQTDPRGNVVEFAYDELNRKKTHIQKKTSGDLTVKYDQYDAEGNLKQLTDAKNQVFSYVYDELNRLTQTNYPLVTTPFVTIQNVSTGYDANNNLATITETKLNNVGGTVIDLTVNTYDNFDRLKTCTQRGMTLTYGYDNNGNCTSVSTVNGATSYSFDTRNRLKTAVVGADTTTYSYTPDGLTETISYPNGTSSKYTYYPTNRVETITHSDNAAAVISSFSYQYDSNGNRTEQVVVQGGVSETTGYVYDDLDRMESYTVTSGVDTTVTGYTFEGYNRKTETVVVNGSATVDKTYHYDETNWLNTLIDNLTSAVITYQYDANGNTTLKADSSKPGEETTFTYDVANRLVQTTQGVTPLGRYDYNAQGMRVRHYGSERGDVEYFYDDGAVLEEYIAGAEGGLLAHYRYGDRLLSLDTGTETQYYHHDALGSTVNLSDDAGVTKVSYSLDPWGHIRNQIGTTVNRQIFTGQEHDEQTGLIYFGARYYDPDTARFISQDSYLGEAGAPPSLHRYLYAYSNPTVYIDLYGYLTWDEAKQGVVRAYSGTKHAFSEAAHALPKISAGLSQLPDKINEHVNPETAAGAVIATTVNVAGKVVLGAVTSPIDVAGETVVFADDPSLENTPILGNVGKDIGVSTAQFSLNSNGDTGLNMTRAWLGGALTVAAPVQVTRSVSKSGTPKLTKEASSGERLDYSKRFDDDPNFTFNEGFKEFSGKQKEDLSLVQYHRSDQSLGQGRSAQWWTTTEQANVLSTISEVRDTLALPPGWGPRDAVSTAKIPKGAHVEYRKGTAKAQIEGAVRYGGEGLQYQFKDFDPSWISDTKKIPGVE